MKAREKIDARNVRAELLPEQSAELLKTLHLLTREGDLNADTRRKLKQVNHLVGLVQPALDDVFARYPSPLVVDVGSGNSYLGFVLYELFFAKKDVGELKNVESRADLVKRSRERAAQLGYGRMTFDEASIEASVLPERVHVLTALHACDTATDDAIVQAVRHKADHVALVPCCQAEVAQQLKESRRAVKPEMLSLFAHAWHRREFGSHLTNVVRALLLESFGYQVTVTELAGWEHSLKNELILARRVHKENREARLRLEQLLLATGVRPKAVRVLWGEDQAVS
ncbi:MAG: SAM-dependent methyltransferase [Myxococcales bacterium]|nr:SAM-dependent methyltransferase [Myxococcales bacterium]